MRNPVTPASTSNELDVQNEWEENTTQCSINSRRCDQIIHSLGVCVEIEGADAGRGGSGICLTGRVRRRGRGQGKSVFSVQLTTSSNNIGISEYILLLGTLPGTSPICRTWPLSLTHNRYYIE